MQLTTNQFNVQLVMWGMMASAQDAQQDTHTKINPVLQKRVWTDWVHPMLPEGWKQQTD